MRQDLEKRLVDFAGKKVLTLAKANYASGMHDFAVNTDKLNEGMYFYTLKINGRNSDSKKMIIIK